jgi:demethylmenaquinone methyltransferase / 2-methoxy-6-polyprenyl-1,4-benzoquinol methylase
MALTTHAHQIREMFSAIAPRYDFLNHFLSLNIDKSWRRQAIRRLAPALSPPGSLCLDLCCGTGDMSLEIKRQIPSWVIGSDFSHNMLQLCQRKLAREKSSFFPLVETDALLLPFPDRSFDGVAIAFGLRNLDDPKTALREMRRVLKPDGQLVVLEFAKPPNLFFNQLFQFYFHKILPWIGNNISKHNTAYSYLPHSVGIFPDQNTLAQLMTQCGYKNVGYKNLTGGIAALHWGFRHDS